MWPLIPKPKGQVSAQEAYTIWDMLSTRYTAVEEIQIFTGMQFMLELHAVALKQNFTNDRLRKIYIDFLWEEISTVDTWIKYGKAKGWLRPVPAYQMTSL